MVEYKTNFNTSRQRKFGTKKAWLRKKGLRQWDDDISKIIADKRQAFNKYISIKKEEDQIDYRKKRAIAKREVRN
ncbi:hypothetical protein ANN_16328 [Periplaneta americana]|uniref:Uncharacterized protein n=1 Tax=Periplaneta americana TaxID=6978 RepID=A0ABQ8SIP3_PERAM|nr:hypothetical protein ANN_16328 [Periplaneta americana]